MSCRSQGINILLNMFFNPAVNAARAVAFQVNTAVMQLEANFFTAIKPQIYKSYAKKEFEDLFRLMMRATIINTFLISIIAFPVISSTSYILGLWLKEVPDYTIVFTQLALINGLVDATNGPLAAAALATGKIRRYELILSSVYISNIPISFIALTFGCDPTATVIISILLSCVAVVVRAYLLRGMMGFPWLQYFSLVMRIAFLVVFFFILTRIIISDYVNDMFSSVLYSMLMSLLVLLFYWFILSSNDRKSIWDFAKSKLRSIKHVFYLILVVSDKK